MSKLSVLLQEFQALESLKRYITAMVLGVFATATLPPFFAFPLGFIAFPGLLLLVIFSKTKKQAFWIGWSFGFGYFVSGLYWFAFALLTDAARFGWMIPFAVFGISAILAFYIALTCLISRYAPARYPIIKIYVFTVCWVLMEYARAHLFTGFSWNLIGYSWAFSDAMIQLASIIGIYGLSFIFLLVVLSPLCFIRIKSNMLCYSHIGIGLLILLPLLVWGGGIYRLSQAKHDHNDAVTLRIVQANIRQHHKWDPELRAANLQKYITTTRQEDLSDITHIIWPESALPYMLDGAPWLLTLLKNMAPANGALLTGGVRTDFNGTDDYHVWNSLFSITKKDGIEAYYDKHHLVPFGEYIPFRTILPVEKITHGTKDFSEGMPPKPLSLSGIPPVLPLICYEAIFPQHLNHSQNAEWILNITNDAWFGNSTGPYQHFTMARIRAVEQGMPLIRAANTGISAVVNAYGITEKKLELFKTGVIDSTLPKAIPEKTIYSRYGDYVLLLMITISGAFTVFFGYRKP